MEAQDLSQYSQVIIEKAKSLREKMFKTRLDGNDEKLYKKWKLVDAPKGNVNGVSKTELILADLLSKGNVIRTGYFCTSIRGFHQYYILVKKT